MNDPFEILFVAFCGVVLTFALIFVTCWCLVSCSFFCLKYFYCGQFNSMISAVSFGGSSTDLEEDDCDCQSTTSTASSTSERYNNRGGLASSLEDARRGTRLPQSIRRNAENIAETGSSSLLETGKVDSPPKYDSPPPYHALFPTDKAPYLHHKGQPPLTPFDLHSPKSNQGAQPLNPSAEFHTVQIEPK